MGETSISPNRYGNIEIFPYLGECNIYTPKGKIIPSESAQQIDSPSL